MIVGWRIFPYLFSLYSIPCYNIGTFYLGWPFAEKYAIYLITSVSMFVRFDLPYIFAFQTIEHAHSINLLRVIFGLSDRILVL